MTWRWISAATRGTSHVRSGEPLQDTAHGWKGGFNDALFVGVVSDGAGSARFGKAGSSLACRSFLTEARAHIVSLGTLPTDDQLRFIVDVARDRIFSIATRRGLKMRDFACTLVAVIADANQAVTVHIGDGAIVGRSDEGSLQTLSMPDHGEYASTTYFLTDESVEGSSLRISRHLRSYTSLALMSDGLERLALSMRDSTPFEPFFDGIFTPVRDSKSVGFDGALSAKLRQYLDTDPVNARTDDDKSLVIAHRV